MKFIM